MIFSPSDISADLKRREEGCQLKDHLSPFEKGGFRGIYVNKVLFLSTKSLLTSLFQGEGSLEHLHQRGSKKKNYSGTALILSTCPSLLRTTNSSSRES